MIPGRLTVSICAFALLGLVLPGRIVKQIDHILFVTGPQGRELISLLKDTFELPVVFDGPTLKPPAPGIALGFGNVALEIVPRPDEPGQPPRTSRVNSLAVQSMDFASTPDALQSSGIAHFPPSAGPTYDGDSGPRYTTIGLQGLGHPMFFIEYRADMDATRARFARRLSERRGGPLGVLRMSEVAVSSTRLDETREQWTRLLGNPSPQDAALWPVGDGPAIRFVSADDQRLGRMVLIVRDLDRAADALTRLQIRAEKTADGLQLDPADMSGLRLTLSVSRAGTY